MKRVLFASMSASTGIALFKQQRLRHAIVKDALRDAPILQPKQVRSSRYYLA